MTGSPRRALRILTVWTCMLASGRGEAQGRPQGTAGAPASSPAARPVGRDPSHASALPAAPPATPASPAGTPPGTWVTYYLVSRATGQGAKLYMAALERKGEAQWWELAVTNERRQTVTYRLLLRGTPDDPGEVLEAIVQPEGQIPLRVPQQMALAQLPPVRPAPRGRDRGADAPRLSKGSETVKVAAGSFTARRLTRVHQGKRTEEWHSAQVPGWSLVKMISPDLVLELVAQGTKARSRIRGEPVKLDPKMLRGGMPGAP